MIPECMENEYVDEQNRKIKSCKCGAPLDALHMGDFDPDLCVECERKIINSMEVEDTTLVLWERGIKYD